MAFNPKTEYDIQRTNIRIRDFDDFTDDYETRPPYQRKVVWEKKKQQALLDSLFRRFYIPSIVLRLVRLDDMQTKYEVVDGQQRINTVQAFFRDELPLPDSLADISKSLPNSTFSSLPAEIKKFVIKELKFDVDIIKNITDPRDPKHQKAATEIFWRLQQGESLNNMETAHARLSRFCSEQSHHYSENALRICHRSLSFRADCNRLRRRLIFLGCFLSKAKAICCSTAKFSGLCPTRIRLSSCRKVTSKTRWSLFSMCQCERIIRWS